MIKKNFLKSTIFILLLSIMFNLSFLGFKETKADNYRDNLLGQISLFAINFEPIDWVECKGQLLSIRDYTALFALIGTTFGGDGYSLFALPDLRNASPVSGTKYYISLNGVFPSREGSSSLVETTMGEISLFPYIFAPAGWSFCQGQAVPTSTNDALYSLIGNTYGSVTGYFNLPNIDATVPIEGLHYCIATSGIYPSESAGVEAGIGTISLFALNFVPGNHMLADGQQNITISTYTALFSLIGTTFGGNGTTNFRLPDLRGAVPLPSLKYCICTQGIFPMRS